MKLKYYLRGLGVGIVLTAVIMGITLGNASARISDEEIIKRAKQLGMVEAESTLSSYSETAKNSEGSDENDDTSSGQTLDKTGEGIFEKIDEGEPSSDQSVPEVAAETSESAATGESSESIESEEDVKLASDDAATTSSTDTLEAGEAEKTEVKQDSLTPDASSAAGSSASADVATDAAADNNADTQTSENDARTKAAEEAAKAEESDLQANAAAEASKADTAAQSTQDVAQAPQESAQEAPENSETAANEAAATAQQTGDVNYVVVVLPSGSESDTCARILREAGVIDDGVAFNKYLVNTGLDRKIRSGTKQVPRGASFEQIASIITK